ncbi:MAG: GNAT family N-acetyltransferase [Solirubrobacterales bacterium]|nr:GNAT family N-acetyltransferase [Solirubrobacterales bacterium]
MHVVGLETITDADWRQVIAGEPEPWGGVGESLRWRAKTHNLGVRDDAGKLVALAGVLLAEARVAGAPLQVAGIGGVIVTRVARGRGLARVMIERALQIAGELPAERAMLFCLPRNVPLYSKFGFQLIPEPVFVRQPSGMIEMPMRAMWKPLAHDAHWPAGRVELPDEPF